MKFRTFFVWSQSKFRTLMKNSQIAYVNLIKRCVKRWHLRCCVTRQSKIPQFSISSVSSINIFQPTQILRIEYCTVIYFPIILPWEFQLICWRVFVFSQNFAYSKLFALNTRKTGDDSLWRCEKNSNKKAENPKIIWKCSQFSQKKKLGTGDIMTINSKNDNYTGNTLAVGKRLVDDC